MREYSTITALRRGEVVELGGLQFTMAVDANGQEQPIQVGDLYLAERNVHRLVPFTIRMKDRIGGATQSIALTLDPGSKTPGLALSR